MAILNDYNQIIREHFDISDTKTRKTIVALEDVEQTQLLSALANALYDKIVDKVDEIDFGTIPRSRGDITKVEGFENTMECLNIIRRMVLEYREDTACVDTVLNAVENIRNRKALFMKAYAMNIEFPMVIYNLIVLCIERSVSFLIATCIQYIKDPATQTLNAALDKVAYRDTKNNLMFEQLISFNKTCLTKELDNSLNDIIKQGRIHEEYEVQCTSNTGSESPFIKYDGEEDRPCTCPQCGNVPCTCIPADPEAMDDTVPVNGGCVEEGFEESINAFKDKYINKNSNNFIGKTALVSVGITAGIAMLRWLIKESIPTARKLTYLFYNTKEKFSNTLAVQAQFLEANAARLKYSTTSDLDEEKRKKIIEKQLKIAEKLKTWANKLAIDNKKAEKQAQEMEQADNKKRTIDDLPPDVVGGLF